MHKSVKAFTLTCCLLGIKGISVLEFDNIAMLAADSALKHYKIRLR